ncbi:hypothetical protein LCGC14_0355910 [marine sediment metagenome]|uniref:Uncharacterized protein n=1 Tax=marine sediment metagenome TaxID=412755 RepID=A0A0F9TF20_9ZZZZ
MLIRIITERKNVRWICELVGEFFPNFTVYRAVGYWRGKYEKSLVIEIDTMNETPLLLDANIRMVCRKICGYNKQQSVLVQKIESKSELLKGNC